MASLYINPRYRPLLQEQGLTTAERILRLEGLIIGGHPDRNVARVSLGAGAETVTGYLKREHRIRWKDRLLNLLAGFGPVSKSRREAAILRALAEARISCPEVIAAGEDCAGRGFLLVRELSDTVDLRTYLTSPLLVRPGQREQLAQRLGEALALMHDAGFAHADLYAKHVLVHKVAGTPSFLDWQRARRMRHVSWPRRWRDLATLDATLPDHLTSERDRLICLHAYLRAALGTRVPSEVRTRALRAVRELTHSLLLRRSVREARLEPVQTESVGVHWLDGEALCVTQAFREQFPHLLPDWLPTVSRIAVPLNQCTQHTLPLDNGRDCLLVRRRTLRTFAWLWDWLIGKPLSTPEVRLAGTLFRLQRFGVRAPRPLAFGQRKLRPWLVDSFLLTESVPSTGTIVPEYPDQRERRAA